MKNEHIHIHKNSTFNFKEVVSLLWSFGAHRFQVKNTQFREPIKCKRSSLTFPIGPETVLCRCSVPRSLQHSFQELKIAHIRMLSLSNSMVQDLKQFLIIARANYTGV